MWDLSIRIRGYEMEVKCNECGEEFSVVGTDHDLLHHGRPCGHIVRFLEQMIRGGGICGYRGAYAYDRIVKPQLKELGLI